MEYLKLDPRGSKFEGWVKVQDTQMLRALTVLERAATQDQGTGRFKMAESHTETFLMTLNEDLHAWIGEVNDHQIPDFQRLNGLESKAALETSGISRKANEALLRVFERLPDAEPAMAKGEIARDAFQSMTAAVIDGAKLLDNLRVPALRQRRRIPDEIRSKAAGGAAPGSSPEPGRPGGAELGTEGGDEPASEGSAGLAAEPISIDELDAMYGGFLLAEEAQLVERTERYREKIEEHERAVRVIALLALLRARRVRRDGTTVPPASEFTSPAYTSEGKLLPTAKVAANHEKVVAAAKEVLPSLDETVLTMKRSKGLVAATKRQIDGIVRELLDDLRKIEFPRAYLDRARRLAGSQWGKAARKGAWGETALGRAAAR